MRALIHYQLTLQEVRAQRNSMGDFGPEMACHTGDGHARGTRNLGAVNCLHCRRALKDMNKIISDPDEVEEEGELVEEGEDS